MSCALSRSSSIFDKDAEAVAALLDAFERAVGVVVRPAEVVCDANGGFESYRRAGCSERRAVQDIHLFEVNEAFAAVALAAMRDAKIPREKQRGARILVTLMYALEARNLKRGLAAICIGGGEAAAMIVERV